jgi:hypothetical protein
MQASFVLLHFAVDATPPQPVRSIWERIANEDAMKKMFYFYWNE